MPFLAAAFLIVALLYASVGFGGGSTYAALLAFAEVDYRLIPVIALACNIVVVAGSSIRFARAGLTPWSGAITLTVIAAPAAFLGGLTPIEREDFLLLLGASLVLTGLGLLIPINGDEAAKARPSPWYVSIIAAPIGYLAGLVGIGGGIFLAPILHLVRWNSARAVAATASLFILVNSLFGLGGQLIKNGSDLLGAAAAFGLPLLLAVVVGGQVGSLLAAKFLPQKWIRWGTAALTILIGLRLIFSL